MAARKVARAPLPPQQRQRPQEEEVVGSMNFGAESSSDGGSEVTDVQLRRQNEQSKFGRGNVTDFQRALPAQQPEQQQPKLRLRRTAYMPNKAPPPPPPPSMQQKPLQSFQSPQRPDTTIVHQTVYTRSKEPASISRLTNPFAPSPRQVSQQPQPWAAGNGNLSHRTSGSRQSLNASGGEGHGGQTLKGRLSSLFRRKSRKPLPPQQQQQQQQWAGNQTYMQQQQQQMQQRQRRHSGGATPAANTQQHQQQQPQHQLASRKNLHTFTYTDAKIYNPNNAVYIAALPASPAAIDAGASPSPVPTTSAGLRGLKGPAPQPPPQANTPTASAEEPGRNPVWWDMRTMGATRSAYSTDVLLVRSPEPVPD